MVALTDDEKAMLAGARGEPRRLAMEHLVQVAGFFDAEDLVEVSQVHIMADSEALGEAGVAFLERLAAAPDAERKVVVPTITDPRGTDFKAYERLRQDRSFVELERRMITAFEALGVLMTDTCINYQTIMPPVLGEHLAFGDTGSVIYANSVLGARSNFEGGPSALAAALTGRAARYGLHLDAHRRGTCRFRLETRPKALNDWGAAGALVGRAMSSYWEVPVIEGVEGAPTSDELKHFGAALASFGSTPMFHMVGVTPEASDLPGLFDGSPPPATPIGQTEIAALHAAYVPSDDRLDVVVFAAPQLSLMELRALAGLLDGRRVHAETTLIAATSPELKSAADRMGLTARMESSGAILLEGVCFYQMHAREIGQANGWQRLMSNSAKLVNIIGGYGYEPVLASMARCVDSAVAGRVLP
ncbi:MAG: aconitase X catalytic domain-containing protein [Rhodospirillales bacterium]|nr:aconitase X catalytic domain-containing protein [Rhodospirillales bacterium]MDH3791113.1 aconitase X catalytic domain-containing protein [Rhodospirillales bacterium]MDH3913585.1 aconitase X catalytic domain-containing protein [Rhodospirillales bacterium]MDH3919295.1 aconitase X catalytic domain-containing protein [Rhodospirillales bacterium]MDH3968719.1 aconitase X catalytic domain-containing protein [Rhodospirillales bacterium]